MSDHPAGTSWPALSYEDREWRPSDISVLPRAERSRQQGIYRAAVPPAIAGIGDIPLSSASLALSEEASAEIARFDSTGAITAPFTSLILRSESASSSKIENLTASAKAIALAELGDPRKRNANTIVANTRAMEAAIGLSERLDASAILDMHTALLADFQPSAAGVWRNEQVWIGGSNYGPIAAEFVPPHHSLVPKAIDDLISFMRRDDLPALVQATIAHAQFETIHPFTDGNGRTGRSLLHALLRAKRLTQHVVVPISAGLLTDTPRYFDALTEYRRGNLTVIVELFANATFLAISNGQRLVDELNLVRENWNDRVTARSDSAVWRVLDLLFRQPVLDSPTVQRELELSATNANIALARLEELEIVKEISGQYRNRKWQAADILSALDSFAERAGRRTL